VTSYREQGKTVLVTTHYMHEAEMLCDRIVILNRGEVVATGSPRELIAEGAPGFVAIFPRATLLAVREHMRPEWELTAQGWQFLVRASSLEDLAELQRISGAVALQLRPSNLEDVYLKLTGRELDENE
jgi:lipooligosaccharide transport system ATP-binding protein